MRVLFVTHSYPRERGDAAGSFLLLLASALRQEGVEVRVLAPAAPGLAPRDDVEGIPVARFRYAPRRWETLAYTGAMVAEVANSWHGKVALAGLLAGGMHALRRERAQFRPHVVHAHWWFPAGLIAASASGSLPLVTTMHGTDVRLAVSRHAARPLLARVLDRSAAVTTVSQWLADHVLQIAPGRNVDVSPMPVAIERFAPGGRREGKRLLFVGRLNEQKGIATLIEALALMTVPASLEVVGDGPDHQALLARASALGLAHRIEWRGAIPRDALPDAYQRAAALVVPSIDEGLGLVAVEAALCETPVVASRSGGLPEVVRDGETGVLVPPRDPQALASALDALLEDPLRAERLAAAGRQWALQAMSPAVVARRYAELYRRVAPSAGPS